MAIAYAQDAGHFIRFSGRVGIWDGATPPTYYSDLVNIDQITITPPQQETVKLISRRIDDYGAALDSQQIATDEVAKLTLTASTMTPLMLEMMTGGTVSEVTQAADAVADEAITTLLDKWVSLAYRPISASGIDLEIPDNTDIAAAKFEVDAELGMIKAIHADAVGTGVISYTKAARTWYLYKAGLAKTTYVHITGRAKNLVDGYEGRIDIWRASVAASGDFQFDGATHLNVELTGDLLVPAVAIQGAIPTHPWYWAKRTA